MTDQDKINCLCNVFEICKRKIADCGIAVAEDSKFVFQCEEFDSIEPVEFKQRYLWRVVLHSRKDKTNFKLYNYANSNRISHIFLTMKSKPWWFNPRAMSIYPIDRELVESLDMHTVDEFLNGLSTYGMCVDVNAKQAIYSKAMALFDNVNRLIEPQIAKITELFKSGNASAGRALMFQLHANIAAEKQRVAHEIHEKFGKIDAHVKLLPSFNNLDEMYVWADIHSA